MVSLSLDIIFYSEGRVWFAYEVEVGLGLSHLRPRYNLSDTDTKRGPFCWVAILIQTALTSDLNIWWV